MMGMLATCTKLETEKAGKMFTSNGFVVPVSFTISLTKSEPKNIAHRAHVMPPTTAGMPGKGPVMACLYSDTE